MFFLLPSGRATALVNCQWQFTPPRAPERKRGQGLLGAERPWQQVSPKGRMRVRILLYVARLPNPHPNPSPGGRGAQCKES